MSDDNGGWLTFCDDHIKEAHMRVKEKFKDRVFEPTDFKQTEDVEYMKCDYPNCEKEPTQEIMWSSGLLLDINKYVELG